MANQIITGVHDDNATVTLLARLTDGAGNLLQQSLVDTINYDVWQLFRDSTTPRHITGPTAVTVSGAIFDALQTDSIWSEDETGYNFKTVVPETAFPQKNQTTYPDNVLRFYRVEVRIVTDTTPVYKFTVPFELQVRSTLYGLG